MKRQINCNHFIKESKKTSVYSYSLIGSELNLCKKCEKKLRKEIIQQDKDEKEINEELKRRGWK